MLGRAAVICESVQSGSQVPTKCTLSHFRWKGERGVGWQPHHSGLSGRARAGLYRIGHCTSSSISGWDSTQHGEESYTRVTMLRLL